MIPEVKDALDKMKVEFANEIGIQLNNEYNGNKTSKLNGYVGGQIGGMITRKAVEDFERKLANKNK